MEKQCTKCRKVKPLSEYGAKKKARQGLNSVCKVCRNKKEQSYKRSRRAYFAAYHAKHKDERRKKMLQRYYERYRHKRVKPYFPDLLKTPRVVPDLTPKPKKRGRKPKVSLAA